MLNFLKSMFICLKYIIIFFNIDIYIFKNVWHLDSKSILKVKLIDNLKFKTSYKYNLYSK